MDAHTNPIALKLNNSFCTSEPLIVVRGLLVPGKYRFQLVIVDEAGISSQPATVSIIVTPPESCWDKLRTWIIRLVKWLFIANKRTESAR